MFAPAPFLLFVNLATFLFFASATPQNLEESHSLNSTASWNEAPVKVEYCRTKNGKKCESKLRTHATCYNLDQDFDRAIVNYKINWGCCTFYKELDCKSGTGLFTPCSMNNSTASVPSLEPHQNEKARSLRCYFAWKNIRRGIFLFLIIPVFHRHNRWWNYT
ncbi:hypothetical protein BZA77DRAFT_290970 [Pyronema omphalodes]|nr:hypothetical protein BZA77DRAFT_290970 [Pyronema omphalodes]